MVSDEEALTLLREAKEVANCDPEEYYRDFLLGYESSGESNEHTAKKVEFRPAIHTALNRNLTEQIQGYLSDLDGEEEEETEPIREIKAFDVDNYEESPSPIQYLSPDEISCFDKFRPFINDLTITSKTDFSDTDNVGFQAFRIKNRMQPELVALSQFTNKQIVGSNFRVKVINRGPQEYTRLEQNPVALPDEFDAIYYDESILVFNPGKFETIFDFYEDYKQDADDVFSHLSSSDINIEGFDKFKKIIKNSKNSVRKMRKIKQRGRYTELDRNRAETLLSEWDMDISIDTDENGDWQIQIPDYRKVGQVLQLLDDNLVVSGMDLVDDLAEEQKYLVKGAQESI